MIMGTFETRSSSDKIAESTTLKPVDMQVAQINKNLLAVFSMDSNPDNKISQLKTEINNDTKELNKTDLALAKIFGKDMSILEVKADNLSINSVMRDYEVFEEQLAA